MADALLSPCGKTGVSHEKFLKARPDFQFFSIVADDGIDTISEGTHDRFIIDAAKFNAKVAAKK